MICLPVLAISCRFWLQKFQIGEMGAELSVMTSRNRHICNPRRVCAKRNLRQKNFTFWSYLRQQYVTVSLPLVKACFLSHYWDNLYLHDTLIALLLLTQPPAHCSVASWEDGQIRGEVFNSSWTCPFQVQ